MINTGRIFKALVSRGVETDLDRRRHTRQRAGSDAARAAVNMLVPYSAINMVLYV